ncbi:MAG: PilZ domain-containing protein [Thermodesulfobacteriota bacterium]|nr:PilZ domain-containing protein [Thermodesulfobacteriota bacterium]
MTLKKRRYDRIDSLNLLSYACIDDEGTVVSQGMGRTLNVSEGGIMLETYELIPTSQILLTIGFKDDMTDVTGKVAYTKTGDNNRIHSGIEFVQTDEIAGGVIKRYIEAFSRHTNEG